MIEKHGIQFPDGTSAVTVELASLSVAIVRKDKAACIQHTLNAMRILWPESVYRINAWSERRVKAFFDDDNPDNFMTWWGPSSSGKTTDAAAIVLTYWLSAPHITMVTLCSTTSSGLMKRIFGELLRLYDAIPKEDRVGEYFSSFKAILLDRTNRRTGIHGVAIQRGTLQEAMGDLVGFHARRNIMVIDEMHATREAAVEAISNLESGEDFHFIGMGNPESRFDPLGRYSEPVDGWESITSADESWKTKFGKCYFFDGRKSPAVVEPNGEAKYPYLINRKMLADRARKYGDNSPRYWSQGIGFIPAEGIENTLFGESFFIKHRMMEKAIWKHGYKLLSSLDPAYAEEGCRCEQIFFKVGLDEREIQTIEFEEPITIELENKKDDPITYQIERKVKEQCQRRAVEPNQLSIDCSGSQTQTADVIEHEWGPGIWRVNFGGPASDLSVSRENPERGNQAFGNRMTELWNWFYQFGRYGHIRGVCVEAVKEFCSRQRLKQIHPAKLETKHQMFGRTGKSPDIADAMVIAIAYVREYLGIVPGEPPAGEKTKNDEEIYRQNSLDNPNEMFLNTPEETYRLIHNEI